MSQQKSMTCRNGCGTEIYFDQSVKSESGKVIPLEVNTKQPHNCPNSPYNLKKSGGAPQVAGASPEELNKIKEKLAEHEKRLTELEMNKWKS